MILALLAACRNEYEVDDPCGLGANRLELGEADLVGAGAAREDDTLDEVVTLTPAEASRRGSAFYLDRRFGSDELEVQFELRIGAGTGADGLALVVADPARAESDRYLGYPGGCLGFASTPFATEVECRCKEGIPGWAVTFDTWWNQCFDPSDLSGAPIEPNGAWVVDGAIDAPGATWALDPVERDRWHGVEVQVSGGQLRVAIDGRDLFGGAVEVPSFLGHVGFTGATGESYDRHEIRGVSIRARTCAPTTP